MTLKKIGVISPGSMGQAIAQQLHSNGSEVCTAINGCSARQISTISAAYKNSGMTAHTPSANTVEASGRNALPPFPAASDAQVAWR